MKRSISISSLLFASISTIIGSGWLFSSYYTAQLAGPAVIIAWILAGIAMVAIAFVYTELCTMLPITGSSVRIPQYTHGTLASFTFAWIIWLSYAALVPTEVQGVIQYLSFFYPTLIKSNAALTKEGFMLATVLMLLISSINIFSLRWLIRSNNALTIMKLIVPTFLAIVLLALHFTPQHLIHPGNSSFLPYGWHGVFAAITTGGIVFAFNGFKQACEMAGEAKNPSRSLPIAIIGSIVICLVIYLLLQMAFISSLNSLNLVDGWHHINLPGEHSPIASLLDQSQLRYLLPILYVGALAGPIAAALMYTSSSSRSLYGMSKNDYIPHLFQKITTQGNPLYAIILNFLFGLFLFAPLPGWKEMVTFLTSLMSVTYAVGPICLLALREQIPTHRRPFKLKWGKTWSTLTFYLCTLLIYWSGWQIIIKLDAALIIGMIVLFIHRLFILPNERLQLNQRCSIWLFTYFIGISIISYFGSYGGGRGLLAFGWDFFIIFIFCLFVLFLALRFKLSPEETEGYVRKLNFKRE